MESKSKKAIEALKTCDPAVISKAASLCDGHSILDPKAFLDAGLPSEIVDYATHEHVSDRNEHKSTIYSKGNPVSSVKGVYGLNLLFFIANTLGLEYPRKHGRGSQATELRFAIFAWAEAKKTAMPG